MEDLVKSLNIWEIKAELDGFLLPEIEKKGQILLESKWGTPLLRQWNKYGVNFLNDYGEKKTDFHFILGFIPIISERIASFFPFKTCDVELLPVKNTSGENFFIVNPCFCDSRILNKRKSKIRYDVEGQISWISEPVFFYLPPKILFKIPDMPTKIYADETFVSIVRKYKFQGIDFIPRKIKKQSLVSRIIEVIYG